MGTLSTLVDRARVKLRDTAENIFTDAVMLGIVNEILHTINDTLILSESNLVYAESSITTASGTGEYTTSFEFESIMQDGVWISGEDWFLSQINEADKIKFDYASATSEPSYYYITEDGKIGFLDVPDDTYTIYVQYFTKITELTDVDTDNLPWDGLFNNAIERLAIVEMLEILERDNSRHAVLAEGLLQMALGKAIQRGTRTRKTTSDFFTVEGI